MTDKGYMLAWLVYLGCSLGLLACVWYLTHALYDWLKKILRALVVVLLLFPWPAAMGTNDLAPAWLDMLFDGLLKQQAPITRAGIPLLLALFVGLLVALVSIYRASRKAS